MENNTNPAAPVREKWTDIELLPEWEEEFYNVYTARKHGKWVMLKALKPEFADIEEYRAMMEREFEVRYNLAHPNIVMINDFDDVPTVGRAIICDDVYGDSLRKLIDTGQLTEAHLKKLQHELVDAIDYIQTNHIVHRPIRPETIYFTQNVGNLKLIDVGFDQKHSLAPSDTTTDIQNYGKVLTEALDAIGGKHSTLRRIAERCTNPSPRHRYHDVQDLHLALSHHTARQLYIFLIGFLTAMILLLIWLKIANPQRIAYVPVSTEITTLAHAY